MDFNKRAKITIVCPRGLTEQTKQQLVDAGFKPKRSALTNLDVYGTLDDCVKLNLTLRFAMYVLYELKEFKCRAVDSLYRQINRIGWEDIIEPDEYISIDSRVDTKCINNTMFPNLKAKDAIVDRIKTKTGSRPDSGPEKENLVINLYWKDDICRIYLNTSGRKLSDRNYRKMPFKAPLQETLAAAIVAEAGYDGSCPLVLPMCGSGTLAIEAAMMALGRSTGLLRTNYCFMHIKDFDKDKYDKLRTELRKKAKKTLEFPIIATDISPKAIEAAQKNAQTAGVDHLIEFSVCDFVETPIPDKEGIIIMNPEYGHRLGEIKELENLYKRIGDFFKQNCPGWVGYVFTGNLELAKKVGLRTSKRVEFFNANIECRLLKYEIYKGTKKQKTEDSKQGTE